MNGVAIGTTGALLPGGLSKAAGTQRLGSSVYPPAMTGMRGNQPGSFDTAHELVWNGKRWPNPQDQTGAPYDLVVVGGGISGLSAAHLYRQRKPDTSRILILDNHDEFGGHARRNEFDVDGQHLIGYGGSQSLESPKYYSTVSKALLQDLSIDIERFYDYFDRDFYDKRKMEPGLYFSESIFGKDRLVPDPFGDNYFGQSQRSVDEILAQFPVSADTRDRFHQFLTQVVDYLPGLSSQEKVAKLMTMSYSQYLSKLVKLTPEGVAILRDKRKSYWALGWDVLSALEAARMGLPGFKGLGLSASEIGVDANPEPYIFHFPDGNAGIARALVRRLIPDAMPGNTMEDLVLARVDYSRLDRQESDVQLRLHSTAVDVRHDPNGKAVDITYVRHGQAERVRAKHVILACYNAMIPHLCPEVPDTQKDALQYAVKSPLVYMTVALRHWRPWAELGFDRIEIPQAPMLHDMSLDFPVSMGGYRFSSGPDKPILMHGTYCPTTPDKGLSGRDQFRQGRKILYGLTFDDFEKDIFRQMTGALGPGGFNAANDIAAITINRWPHGYAYEYNHLEDDPSWGPGKGPHVTGRAQMGRISIANSDASAYAYVDGAIDAAHRAVNEQLGI